MKRNVRVFPGPRIYAGCLWLILASFLAVTVLLAMAASAPLAWAFAVPAAIAGGLGALLLREGGARFVPASILLGGALTVVGLLEALLADPTTTTGDLAIALIGAAIALSSAFAYRADRRN